jgi:GTP-binding protein
MDQAHLRNVAIIAHVDHGKTTLVDALLAQSGRLAAHKETVDRVLDSNAIERERGITILGKATSVRYRGVKINIADTPGHADFGGEVERMLTMVDGALLLVDASEGPLPQTRFVLGKTLDAGLAVIVVINKIDRSDARSHEVLDEVYDLFIDLGASDEQIEFPVLYTNAKAGTATAVLDQPGTDLQPLLDAVLAHIPPPKGDPEAHLQALVTNLDYNNYLGRLGLGRVVRGTLREGEQIAVLGKDGARQVKLGGLYVFEGLERSPVASAPAGELFAVSGIDDVTIGDTLAAPELPEALPRVRVDEPTITMVFSVNNSPMAGLDGKHVTSRKLFERLEREARANVSIRLEPTPSPDAMKVAGRGELALAIIIENMRREGYELCVSKPHVVTRTDDDGHLLEPMERLVLDLPDDYLGVITQKLAPRKGRMIDLRHLGSSRVRAQFDVPARGLIGFRGEYLNDTRGEGIMNTLFNGWGRWQGDIRYRVNGAIIADRAGRATPYALFNLQPRGTLFVGPGTDVYEGMVIGEHAKTNGLDVNVTREKKLTNIRAAGADESIILTPPRLMSLEDAIHWIDEDELVEVTPKSVRIRKRVLQANMRDKKK